MSASYKLSRRRALRILGLGAAAGCGISGALMVPGSAEAEDRNTNHLAQDTGERTQGRGLAETGTTASAGISVWLARDLSGVCSS
jgi:predicted small lipoprotein YifL